MEQTNAKKAVVYSTVFPILFAISSVHLLNDTMQSAISALFPVIRDTLHLSYTQIGLIALMMNLTASLLQPLIGIYSDSRPFPFILPIGVCFTLAGIVSLAIAPNFGLILMAVMLVGVGSAIFHPESSRVAYLASGGRRGLAQSIFQVGGNLGSSLGPIMTALIFVPFGQISVLWFAIAAVIAIVIQWYVASWYSGVNKLAQLKAARHATAATTQRTGLPKRTVSFAVAILILLTFSKNVYSSSITSFYSFYLIDDYGVSVGRAQMYLFAFLAASAIGTFLGGPLADRFGRRNIIWLSILGTAPFSMLLPYADLFWSGVLCVMAGLVLSSAFSIIVVYAQELMPGKVGLVAGLFFGLAFGLGGVGSAVLGWLADQTSIEFIMKMTAFLPLIGLATMFLPKDKELKGA